MKMFSRQFPIKRTNSRGHTTIIEGPNLFCQKSSFHCLKKDTSFKLAKIKSMLFEIFQLAKNQIHDFWDFLSLQRIRFMFLSLQKVKFIFWRFLSLQKIQSMFLELFQLQNIKFMFFELKNSKHTNSVFCKTEKVQKTWIWFFVFVQKLLHVFFLLF